MRDDCRVALIIPALNEASNLPAVLGRVPEWIDRVLVVDNGSTDATASVARQLGAIVLDEPRRGYGWACARGAAACRNFEILLFADADGSDDLSQAHTLVDPIVQGEADLALGNRLAGLAEHGALSWPQRWGNRLACSLLRWRFGHRYGDLGPLRAIRTSALQDLRLRQMTYGWTVEMQIRAVLGGYRVLEIPVHYRARIAGRSKVSRSVIGVVRAGHGIIKTILTEPRR